ncbi:hypothetical protein BDN72DRAFT_860203 [Pluteus cervinus]|uniref:Uncharacterized protein n=1 Tax=Pluteus cervinus TaxID=181527 RepID=A0ACD3AKH3_9AGAR|nr:hypothetical protein BDN72DRAFT_860203 [Pluteus cervinus]
MPKQTRAGKETSANDVRNVPVSFGPVLTRSAEKRKLELGEVVQLYSITEADHLISNTCHAHTTKCRKFGLKTLVSRYEDDGLGGEGREASFLTLEGSEAFIPPHPTPESPQRHNVLDGEPQQKQLKASKLGDYIVDGVSTTPKLSGLWKYNCPPFNTRETHIDNRSLMKKPNHDSSHRPSRTSSNTSHKPARRSRDKNVGHDGFSLQGNCLVTGPGREPPNGLKDVLIQMWGDGGEKFYNVHITK